MNVQWQVRVATEWVIAEEGKADIHPALSQATTRGSSGVHSTTLAETGNPWYARSSAERDQRHRVLIRRMIDLI